MWKGSEIEPPSIRTPLVSEYEFSTAPADEGRRLDEFLEARFPQLSRMRLRAAIARGGCLVNGRIADRGVRLRAGDTVRVAVDTTVPTAMRPEPLPVQVLYEDAWLAVVVKPAGMLMHPTRNVKTGTLANALAWLWNPHLRCPDQSGELGPVIRPGFPHRLDRDTSGLLVVAKSPVALRKLSRAFGRREVEKRYTALVAGRVASDEFEVNAPIGHTSEEKPHWRVLEGGKPALTRARVLERKQVVTLVELEPLTGRTNQLRIHCAHAGHPILGDVLYGGPPAPRLCLHASVLGFQHPETGQPLRFVSEPPTGMLALFDGER